VTADRPVPPKAPIVGRLLEPLVRHGIDFVVVGGIAGSAHGSTYPTFDLDVAYARDRPNVERLVRALAEIGVTLRGAPDDLPFQLDVRTFENGLNFTFSTSQGDIDVLGDPGGIKSYAVLRENAARRTIAGYEVLVASIDHLIAMKRAANRNKDKLMLEEYIVIADEQQRVGGDQLDEGSSS
jgi:hypothetical protein